MLYEIVHKNFLIDSLASAGNSESQDVLLTLFEEGAEGDKFRVFSGLMSTSEPTDDNILLHKELLSDDTYGAQAHYGLGAHVNSLLGTSRERADELFEILVSKLNGAQSISDKLFIIGALGNTKHPMLATVLLPYVDDTEGLIRLKVLKAFQDVPGIEIDELYSQRSISEAEPSVRIVAIQELGKREYSEMAVQSLFYIMQNEQDNYIRKYTAAAILSLKRTDRVSVVIQWILNNEQNADILKMVNGNL